MTPPESPLQTASPTKLRSPRANRIPIRTAVNYWVDAALAVAFLVLAWLMAIPPFVFPAAADAHHWRLWGATIDDWRWYQFIAFCVFSAMVVGHVALHWNWVCSISSSLFRKHATNRDDGSRTILGVIVLMGLLHLLFATLLWARWSVVKIG